MIELIKGERHPELAKETFFLEEKPSGNHLPFKKRFVSFESGSVSTSSRIRFNRENATSPLIPEESFCEELEKHSITSSKHAQDSRKCYSFGVVLCFLNQLFEDDSELRGIQYSASVGAFMFHVGL